MLGICTPFTLITPSKINYVATAVGTPTVIAIADLNIFTNTFHSFHQFLQELISSHILLDHLDKQS